MPVHCHRTEQSFHSRCFAIFPGLYRIPAIPWNIKNNMDYGCNGLVKIHFITVSQISQEGQCKTLHHGRTNKILFRSHWMMRAAAHFDFMRFCTHIRYTHTLCVCVWRVRPLQCSRTISYWNWLKSERALLFQAGLIAASSDLSHRKRENRRRPPLPNQINSDGHRWTNWLYIYTDSHSRPCRVYCGALAFDSPKRGTCIVQRRGVAHTHSQVWQSRRCFYLLGNPALPDNAAAATTTALLLLLK